MNPEKLSSLDIMLLMTKLAATTNGPMDTIAATAAVLVRDHSYGAKEADEAARQAFEKWIESYEGGFS